MTRLHCCKDIVILKNDLVKKAIFLAISFGRYGSHLFFMSPKITHAYYNLEDALLWLYLLINMHDADTRDKHMGVEGPAD